MRVFAAIAALSAVAAAKRVVVTVGGNTTDDVTTVFEPAQLTANIGDTVFFNFTQGTHSVVQSEFPSPCTPAHESNSTVNSFNTGPRPANNGTSVTNFEITITSNQTIWFFDNSTCAEGGVGGINVNDSSTETLDGFRRNAIRLYGEGGDDTDSTSSTSSSTTKTGPSPTAALGDPNDATRTAVTGLMAIVPLVLAALAL